MGGKIHRKSLKNDYFIHPKLKISTQMIGNDEKVVEIEIERLHDFKNHPFKVQADSQMKELQDSISKYGILNQLIVRPRPEGFYEVISGHRRKYAAMELKYTKVPVIIRYMIDLKADQDEIKEVLGNEYQDYNLERYQQTDIHRIANVNSKVIIST